MEKIITDIITLTSNNGYPYNSTSMFAKKNKYKSEHIDMQVKLKNIFGVEPGKYLTVLYLSVIALIFFGILFLPGLINCGSRVTFSTNPPEASVWINGEYAGTTPFTGFMEKGLHEVVFMKPGFHEKGEVLDVKGHFFATLFKKPELTVERKLEISDYRKLLEFSLDSILRWAAVEDYHEAYQPELLISKTIDSLPEAGRGNIYTEVFLEKSLKNITREYFLADFVKAFYLYSGKKNPLAPLDTTNVLKSGLLKITENKEILMHLMKILDDNTSLANEKMDLAKITELLLEKRKAQNTVYDYSFISNSTGSRKNILIGNKVFSPVPEGLYLIGSDNPDFYSRNYPFYPSCSNVFDVEYFLISDRMVTNREYLEFTEEVGFWSSSNADELANRNLADQNYLSHWVSGKPLNSDMDLPVVNISYYASEAYAEWFSGKLEKPYKAVIPDEYMWEAAYIAAGDKMEKAIGSIWNWCSNWFNYADYINPEVSMNSSVNKKVSTQLDNIEKSLRGGNLTDSSGRISPWTRASLPPQWCTPFTGARVAIILEN